LTVLTKTGSWTSRANTGTDVITGVGFTPKVIIVYSNELTNANLNSFQPHFAFHFGVAVGTTATTDQRCFSTVSLDNSASSSVYRGWFQGIINNCSSTPAFTAKATISVIGSDGFTVNWSQQDAARDYFYLCIGGSDITNVDVGAITLPTAGTTGDVSYTGPNFQPDFVMLFGAGASAEDQVANDCTPILGVANGSTQGAFCGISEQARATMDTARYQRSDKCLVKIDSTDTATKALEASFNGFTSTGFTLNYTTVTADAASDLVGYVVIKGIGSKIGTLTTPTSGGTPVSQTTTVNVAPVGLIMMGAVQVASTSITTTANQFVFGTASSSSSRNVCYAADNDNVPDSVTVRQTNTTHIIRNITAAATEASSTLLVSADLTSFGSYNFILSYDTIDVNNAIEHIYVAFANAPVTLSVTPSDTTSLSESDARHLILKRSPTDTKTLSESLTKVSTLKRLASDTKTLSESNLRRLTLKRLPSETTLLNEAVDSFLGFAARTISDTTTISESLSRSVVLVPRTASDTSTLSESNLRMLILKRLISNTTTLSESNIRRLSLKRLQSDTTSLSESNIRRATKIRLLSNTITLSESLARALRLGRAITNTTTLSESLSRVLKSIRLLTDTKTLSEVIDTIVGLTQTRSPSDTTTLSESVLRHLILLRTTNDSISLTEQVLRRLSLIRLLTETTNLGDALARHLLLKRLLTDTKTLSESIIHATVQIRMPSDTSTLSDSLARILLSIRSPSDIITLSEDAILTHQELIRTPEDTILLDEAIDASYVGEIVREISDTIFTAESLIRYGSTIALVSDTITLSESLAHYRSVIRRAEDFIGHIRYKRHITNTTSLTESIFRLIRPLKHPITDDITLSENVVATLIPSGIQAIRRPTDTITLSDLISRQLSHSRTASESMLQREDPASEDMFYGIRPPKIEQKIKEEEPLKVAYVTPATHEVASQISKTRDHSLFKRRKREKSSIFY
jgi:hypothetical protein